MYISCNPTYHRAFTTQVITNSENNEHKGVSTVVQVVHLTPPPPLSSVYIKWLPRLSNRMSIPILRSHNRNMFLFWCGFPHLNKKVSPPPPLLSSDCMTTAAHSLGQSSSLATFHIIQESASSVFVFN